MNKFNYHVDGTSDEKKIFVFGSNLAGVHGAGAARAAALYFGALRGVGVGFASPRSYAIPTKDYHIQTISLTLISFFVRQFANVTHEQPKMKFFVTRIGCGLAGYTDEQIAPMFAECNHNCDMPEEWKIYLEK